MQSTEQSTGTLAEGRDRLTGLYREAGALRQLSDWQEAARNRGERAPIHAMLIALKRFSAVSLAYGEAAGDAALVELSSRVLQFARGEVGGKDNNDWIVARLESGAFLLAANEPCSRERWQWLAEELSQVIAQPIVAQSIVASGEGAQLRLWPRIALLRGTPSDTPTRMITRLGDALEKNQHQSGRRQFWVDGEANMPGRSASQLEADILAALDRDEIEILYQPQFSAETGALVGGEALARWQHPELGSIGAGALFAIAERADHVGQLTRHILHRALVGANAWVQNDGEEGGASVNGEPLRLSLNVTAADLSTRFFADMVTEALTASGFPAEKLTLEITEQALVVDLEQSAEHLRQLSQLGIRIALDDFGAGFCNFRYLKILPLDYLKLDRSMIDGIADDPRDLAVLRGILAMAKALDLAVVAEGVESEAQREVIAHEGCAVWQGFLGAEPMSEADFCALLAESSAL